MSSGIGFALLWFIRHSAVKIMGSGCKPEPAGGTIRGLEVHDRVILATARLTGSPLVSNDREIHAKGVKVIW
ncbi:MAG: hypothetical protein L3J17_02175 [Candidatus Jettenia sp.]|nr:MAG: hypothetical protein L3J17_02175 [Candidatus Jettenia sp.]